MPKPIEQPNYDESRIPPYTLLDPLCFLNGAPVASPQDWSGRRAEILGLFAQRMFGKTPNGAWKRVSR